MSSFLSFCPPAPSRLLLTSLPSIALFTPFILPLPPNFFAPSLTPHHACISYLFSLLSLHLHRFFKHPPLAFLFSAPRLPPSFSCLNSIYHSSSSLADTPLSIFSHHSLQLHLMPHKKPCSNDDQDPATHME